MSGSEQGGLGERFPHASGVTGTPARIMFLTSVSSEVVKQLADKRCTGQLLSDDDVPNAGSTMPAGSHSKPLHKALRGQMGERRCAKAVMSSPLVERK